MKRTETMRSKIRLLWLLALVAAAVGAIAAILGIVFGETSAFFQAYLIAFISWLGLSLGALGLLMMYYLMGGQWGVAIRQVLEGATKTLWLMAPLFIPLALGVTRLYPWAQVGPGAAENLPPFKGAYLGQPFFLGRGVFYFLLWIGLAFILLRWSRLKESWVDPTRRRFQRLSAFGLILYVFSMTFAAVDWILSLETEWISTIFGFLIVTAQGLAGLSFAILVIAWLDPEERLANFLTPGLYRDLGALLLTAVLFWAYLAFSQLLIIYAGNIPREASWYVHRSSGGWLWPELAVIVIQFFLPFTVLLSLRAKRNPGLLAALSAGILIMRIVDYFWLVKPSFSPGGISIHWLDLAVQVGMGGLWLAAFAWFYHRTPLELPETTGTESAAEASRGMAA